MRTCYVFLWLFLIVQGSLAQTRLPNGKATNRVKSTAKATPDLIGVLTVNPDIIHGPTSITAVIDVVETKKVPTSGVITVFVLKNTSFVNFTFSPTATSIGSTKVQNANWSFDATTNPDFYIFTSTKVIAGGAFSTIGLTGPFTTNATGKVSFSMTIVKGSGGEANGVNNTASTAVNYSPE